MLGNIFTSWNSRTNSSAWHRTVAATTSPSNAGGLDWPGRLLRGRSSAARLTQSWLARIGWPIPGGGDPDRFDETVPILILFWGDPTPYVKDAHRRGIKIFIQVGSLEEAMSAVAAGVDAIIAQGLEAGGHVKSTISLSTLVPAVVKAVAPVPVIASGGIATGRGLVAALSLGAEAISVGTRFLASEEACVPQEYKERVVKSRAEDTIYGQIFDIGWGLLLIASCATSR